MTSKSNLKEITYLLGPFLLLSDKLKRFDFYSEYISTRSKEELEVCFAIVCMNMNCSDAIGWCGYELAEDNTLFVSPLEVREGYRNMGIGSTLLEDVERRAALNGCHACQLVAVGNKAFYLKRGYRQADIGNGLQGFLEKAIMQIR